MKNDLECFCNDNLYICVTGFHAYEKEGMGLRKFGNILLLFQRERERCLMTVKVPNILKQFETRWSGKIPIFAICLSLTIFLLNFCTTIFKETIIFIKNFLS